MKADAALLERIRQRCVVDDCWHWRGAVSSGGPRIWINKKCYQVRRLVLGARGSRVAKVKCGSSDCVKPGHLRSVTKSQAERGKFVSTDARIRITNAIRSSRRRKLTLDIARQIRERVRAGIIQRDVAREFGVTQQCVSQISTNQLWRESSPWAI